MKKIREIKEKIKLHYKYLSEAYHFWRLTVKYNATNNTDNDLQKMQYTLLRENHVIEKGMSLRNPRKGFGQQKVKALIKRLHKYFNLYGEYDRDFLRYPLSTIKNYIVYTEASGTSIPDIKTAYSELEQLVGFTDIEIHAGISTTTKQEIIKECNKSFESLLFSRHSLRYFADKPIDKTTIIKALELAQRTPSACNRQGWLTHVFFGEESVKLIKWQGGSNGFEEEIKCSILVTANLKAFLSHEVHQAYIDGGLYAMNLINALHSLGLGTIPLSCGFYYNKLKKLTHFSIPANEIPIVIIGVGELQDTFNVAVSTRKSVSSTNTFH